MAEKQIDLITRLQKGEKVVCSDCKKGVYITDIKEISKSTFFVCNNCGSIYRVSKNVVVE